ncbi:hypothetical protein JW859_05280 [bacterium]|nr:hypothetical protein [bacterium]
MQQLLRFGILFFVALAWFVLAGCGGGSTVTPDPGDTNNDPVITGTWEGTAATSAVDDPGFAGVPDIPFDTMTTSRAASQDNTQLELLGSDFLQQLNATVAGTTLVLNAPSTPVGGFDIAFGLYRFQGLTEVTPEWLNVECLPASFGQQYYVAIADYTLGDWRWFGPVTFPEFQLDLSDLNHHIVTELGNMYFVVVCESGNSATISRSVLTVGAGGGEDPDLLPGVPHGLIATDGVYDEYVVIEWDNGADADHYELWRKCGEDGEWDDLAIVEGNRYEDHAVTPGQLYWYKARSVNEHGTSGWSNHDSGYAGELGEDPGVGTPFDLQATDGEFVDKIFIWWEIEGNYDYFELWRKQGEDGEWGKYTEVEDLEYLDLEVTPGVYYHYKVFAVYGGQTSEHSNIDYGYAGEIGGETGEPYDLVASDGTHEEKVVVEWNCDGDGAFDVYRRVNEEGAEWGVIDETTDHYYYDWDAEPGVVYAYKVRVWHDGVAGGYSNTDTGYAGQGGGPGTPWDLIATDGLYPDKIRCEWYFEGDYDYFEVWRKRAGDGYEWAKIDTTEAMEYDDYDLPGDYTFWYKVRAVLDEQTGDWSNADSGYLQDTEPVLNKPLELVATDGLYEDKVRVEWYHEGDYEYFEIWRVRDGEGYEWTKIGETEDKSYNDYEVDAGVHYYYKARTVDGDLTSEWSNHDEGWAAGGDRPPAPWELSASDGTHEEKVVVTWHYEIEGAWFDVYRMENVEGAAWTVLDETQDLTYYDFEVDGDTVYVYKVVAWVGGVNSDPSNHDTGYASGGGSGPQAPWDLVASDGEYTDKVLITWSYEGDAFYDVYRKVNEEGAEWGVIGETGDKGYHDTAAVPGTVYVYKAVAWVGGVPSDPSNTDTGYRAEADPPNTPTELWASDGTHVGYVRIEWAFEGDYSYFDLWRKRDGGEYEWQRLTTTEGLGWSDDELDTGVIYIYKVRAILNDVEGEWSNTDTGWAASEG